MFHDLLLYIPSMVCLMWLIIHSVLSYRANAFPSLAAALTFAMLYFAIDAYYASIHTTPASWLLLP